MWSPQGDGIAGARRGRYTLVAGGTSAQEGRSRSELVGQIFLEHYVPRWEDLADSPAGWFAKASPIPAGRHPDLSPAPDPARRSG
jgi:hypothetical protein